MAKEVKEKQGHISDLIQDDKNFNKHSEYGMGLLEKSVSKFGMGRSILVDKNNKIIAGNGITETAGNVGIEKVKFVDTDGTEIIAVRRKDIDLDTPEGREMALADNATNKANLQWDEDNLGGVCEEFGIDAGEWGVEDWKPMDENDIEENEVGKPTSEEWFLNIHFENEQECQKWFDKLTKEGLECKIVQ